MKNKAINNLNSAQMLINNGHFTSSIHCSYYAVLQYMKYMLANTSNSPMTYEDQDRGDTDTHNYILQAIRTRISNPRNAVTFANNFRDLKHARVSADYRQKAVGLITNLKTYFGNI